MDATERRTERVLQLAGLLMWAVAAWPTGAAIAANPALAATPRTLGWLAAAAAWLAGFLVATRPGDRDCPPGWRGPLFVTQGVAALVMSALGSRFAEAPLLVVVAAQAPFLLPMRRAAAVLAALDLGLVALIVERGGSWGAVGFAVSLIAFQAFAAGAGWLAVSQACARAELAALHAELLAARALLAEGARESERMRIARDLHDAVGHHLAALSLNLEAAGHLARGDAVEPVRAAQQIARGLLGEVRAAVGALRDGADLDLGRALAALASELPAPRLHVTLAPGLEVRDAALARALFHCVREAVTNAIRHSRARNVWVALERTPSGLRLAARDDGGGAAAFRIGHGLAGMRERIAELGGRVEVEPRAGAGFGLTVEAPVREGG